MLNDRSSALALLKTRRSGRPRDLIEPGPDSAELRQMIEIAVRTPDHGKLAPWRFVHVAQGDREAFRQLLEAAYRQDCPEPAPAQMEAVARFALQAPELVIALFSPVAATKIPLWEQELSCGAACMNLLAAAHALGFAAGWVTGWAAYSEMVLRAFGTADERIAGFIFIGSPACPLEERVRPTVELKLSRWSPAG
jgi:nitroreductase